MHDRFGGEEAVTMTLGVATLDLEANAISPDNPHLLVQQADPALYRAK